MVYRFASCVLDTQLRELAVGGAAVHLEPQVFDVLRYLLEMRERVVSRDELIEAVWAGRIVSEATLSARIWAARQAVGDTGELQAVIRTLPRRGFRFVAPVTVDDPSTEVAAGPSVERPLSVAASEPGNRPALRLRFAMAAAGLVLLLMGAGVGGQLRHSPPETATVELMAYPLPDKPSLAVLPFANLSSEAAQGFMGEGLTESLVNALAKNPSLFIISHSSTSTYTDQPVTAKRAAEELGVRYILEGSVKRAGDEVRVMTELVDAIEGMVLWSERYQLPADDLFRMEEEITAQIARSLDIRIIYGSEQSSGGTRSLGAWAAYMQGRTEYLTFTMPGIMRAREHFLRALELDAHFAESMVALANTHFVELTGLPVEDWGHVLNQIEELDSKAASIAPRMPRLLELRSMLAMTEGDYDRALMIAEAMVNLDPNGAESHYVLGRMCFFTGQYERAIESLSKAIRINPHSRASYSSHLAFSYLAVGKTDVAVSILETVAERWPEYSSVHAYLAIIYQYAGRTAEARQQVTLLPSVAPDWSMLVVERRFSPMRDQKLAARIIDAAREAGIPGSADPEATIPAKSLAPRSPSQIY